MLKKSLSLLISFCLVWTSGGVLDAALTAPDIFAVASDLPQFQLIPPGQLGRIADYYNAPTGPLVILIQDLHTHYGVQKNIAGILDFLSDKLPVGAGLVPARNSNQSNSIQSRAGTRPAPTIPFALAVEGASGRVDSSVLALFPDEKIKLAAADYLMREGELTGAEYFAIKHGQPNLLVGAENEKYYTVHRDLFRKTWQDRSELVSTLKSLKSDIDQLPRYVFRKNKALWDFHKRMEAYDKGEISTHEFIGMLMDHVGAGLVPARNTDQSNLIQSWAGTRPAPTIDVKRDFPTLASFASNSRFGTMEEVRSATSELMTQIQGGLTSQEKADLKLLVKKEGTGTYYLYLRELIYKKQLFMAVPPVLAQYMEYIHTAQTMGMDRVTHEAKELAFRVEHNIAQNDPQARDLVQVRHDLDLLLRLSDLQATEYEVRDFAPRVNQFVALTKSLVGAGLVPARNTDPSNSFPSPSDASSLRAGTRPAPTFDETKIRRLISSSIDFYVMALMRNKPMLENTLALHEPVKVLVAGGFHTVQLTNLLREKNVSYLVITPTVEKLTDADHDLYVKRLNGQLQTEEDIATELADRNSLLHQVARKHGLEQNQWLSLPPAVMKLWSYREQNTLNSLDPGDKGLVVAPVERFVTRAMGTIRRGLPTRLGFTRVAGLLERVGLRTPQPAAKNRNLGQLGKAFLSLFPPWQRARLENELGDDALRMRIAQQNRSVSTLQNDRAALVKELGGEEISTRRQKIQDVLRALQQEGIDVDEFLLLQRAATLDPNNFVRVDAIEALGALGFAELRTVLERFTEDTEPEIVRQAARKALAILTDRSIFNSAEKPASSKSAPTQLAGGRGTSIGRKVIPALKRLFLFFLPILGLSAHPANESTINKTDSMTTLSGMIIFLTAIVLVPTLFGDLGVWKNASKSAFRPRPYSEDHPKSRTSSKRSRWRGWFPFLSLMFIFGVSGYSATPSVGEAAGNALSTIQRSMPPELMSPGISVFVSAALAGGLMFIVLRLLRSQTQYSSAQQKSFWGITLFLALAAGAIIWLAWNFGADLSHMLPRIMHQLGLQRSTILPHATSLAGLFGLSVPLFAPNESSPGGINSTEGRQPASSPEEETISINIETPDPKPLGLVPYADEHIQEGTAAMYEGRLNDAIDSYRRAETRYAENKVSDDILRPLRDRIAELVSVLPDPSKATPGKTIEGRLKLAHEAIVAQLLKMHPLDRPLKVVDVGIGWGGAPTTFDLGKQLHQAGFSDVTLIGVDKDPNHVAQAQERLHSESIPSGLHLSFREGGFDLSAAGLQDADLVVAANVLIYYHGAERDKSLSLIRRGLAPTGILAEITGPQEVRTVFIGKPATSEFILNLDITSQAGTEISKESFKAKGDPLVHGTDAAEELILIGPAPGAGNAQSSETDPAISKSGLLGDIFRQVLETNPSEDSVRLRNACVTLGTALQAKLQQKYGPQVRIALTPRGSVLRGNAGLKYRTDHPSDLDLSILYWGIDDGPVLTRDDILKLAQEIVDRDPSLAGRHVIVDRDDNASYVMSGSHFIPSRGVETGDPKYFAALFLPYLYVGDAKELMALRQTLLEKWVQGQNDAATEEALPVIWNHYLASFWQKDINGEDRSGQALPQGRAKLQIPSPDELYRELFPGQSAASGTEKSTVTDAGNRQRKGIVALVPSWVYPLSDAPARRPIPSLSRFNVIGYLGSGADCAVYLAEDRENGNRLVALKDPFHRPGLLSLYREVDILRELGGQPGILRAEEIKNGRTSIVVAEDYVDGPSLESVIKAWRAHETDAKERRPILVHVANQILETLESIHQKELVHRDIKPSNIRLGPDRAVITDYGTVTHTGTYDPAGTPGFIPEAVRTRSEPYGLRSDIYALGITLQVALASPEDGFDLTPYLHDADPGVAGMARIIQRAIRPDATDRYQTIEEMRSDLTRLETGRLPRGQRGGAPASFIRKLARPWVMGPVGLLLTSVLAHAQDYTVNLAARTVTATITAPSEGATNTVGQIAVRLMKSFGEKALGPNHIYDWPHQISGFIQDKLGYHGGIYKPGDSFTAQIPDNVDPNVLIERLRAAHEQVTIIQAPTTPPTPTLEIPHFHIQLPHLPNISWWDQTQAWIYHNATTIEVVIGAIVLIAGLWLATRYLWPKVKTWWQARQPAEPATSLRAEKRREADVVLSMAEAALVEARSRHFHAETALHDARHELALATSPKEKADAIKTLEDAIANYKEANARLASAQRAYRQRRNSYLNTHTQDLGYSTPGAVSPEAGPIAPPPTSASGPSGSLRRVRPSQEGSDPTNEALRQQFRQRQPEFEDLSRRGSPLPYDFMGQTIHAFVIEADFGEGFEREGGYQFETETAGTYVIVLNSRSSENARKEALFHEQREIGWITRHFTQPEAHIIASYEQAASGTFANHHTGLTEFHTTELNRMSAPELRDLIQEYRSGGRGRHRDLLARARAESPSIDQNKADAYERRFVEYALEQLSYRTQEAENRLAEVDQRLSGAALLQAEDELAAARQELQPGNKVWGSVLRLVSRVRRALAGPRDPAREIGTLSQERIRLLREAQDVMKTLNDIRIGAPASGPVTETGPPAAAAPLFGTVLEQMESLQAEIERAALAFYRSFPFLIFLLEEEERKDAYVAQKIQEWQSPPRTPALTPVNYAVEVIGRAVGAAVPAMAPEVADRAAQRRALAQQKLDLAQQGQGTSAQAIPMPATEADRQAAARAFADQQVQELQQRAQQPALPAPSGRTVEHTQPRFLAEKPAAIPQVPAARTPRQRRTPEVLPPSGKIYPMPATEADRTEQERKDAFVAQLIQEWQTPAPVAALTPATFAFDVIGRAVEAAVPAVAPEVAARAVQRRALAQQKLDLAQQGQRPSAQAIPMPATEADRQAAARAYADQQVQVLQQKAQQLTLPASSGRTVEHTQPRFLAEKPAVAAQAPAARAPRQRHTPEVLPPSGEIYPMPATEADRNAQALKDIAEMRNLLWVTWFTHSANSELTTGFIADRNQDLHKWMANKVNLLQENENVRRAYFGLSFSLQLYDVLAQIDETQIISLTQNKIDIWRQSSTKIGGKIELLPLGDDEDLSELVGHVQVALLREEHVILPFVQRLRVLQGEVGELQDKLHTDHGIAAISQCNTSLSAIRADIQPVEFRQRADYEAELNTLHEAILAAAVSAATSSLGRWTDSARATPAAEVNPDQVKKWEELKAGWAVWCNDLGIQEDSRVKDAFDRLTLAIAAAAGISQMLAEAEGVIKKLNDLSPSTVTPEWISWGSSERNRLARAMEGPSQNDPSVVGALKRIDQALRLARAKQAALYLSRQSLIGLAQFETFMGQLQRNDVMTFYAPWWTAFEKQFPDIASLAQAQPAEGFQFFEMVRPIYHDLEASRFKDWFQGQIINEIHSEFRAFNDLYRNGGIWNYLDQFVSGLSQASPDFASKFLQMVHQKFNHFRRADHPDRDRLLAPAAAIEQAHRYLQAIEAGRVENGGYQIGQHVDLTAKRAPRIKETVIITDTHGHAEYIRKALMHRSEPGGKTLLEKLEAGEAVFKIVGDAVHPEHGDFRDMIPSLAELQLIMHLKICFPQNFYFEPADHEYLEVGTRKGGEPQGWILRDLLLQEYGQEYVDLYQAAIQRSPLFGIGDGYADIHAGPIRDVGLDQMDNIPIEDVFRDQQDPRLVQATWSRPVDWYDAQPARGQPGFEDMWRGLIYTQADVSNFLKTVGQPNGVLIVGHTHLSKNPEEWHSIPKSMPNTHVISAARRRGGVAIARNGKVDFQDITDVNSGLFQNPVIKPVLLNTPGPGMLFQQPDSQGGFIVYKVRDRGPEGDWLFDVWTNQRWVPWENLELSDAIIQDYLQRHGVPEPPGDRTTLFTTSTRLISIPSEQPAAGLDPIQRAMTDLGYTRDYSPVFGWLYDAEITRRMATGEIHFPKDEVNPDPKEILQGWKFHVSLQNQDAEQVLKIILPILQELGLAHKLRQSMKVAQANWNDQTQAGKDIAVYIMDSDIERLADQFNLHRLASPDVKLPEVVAMFIGLRMDEALKVAHIQAPQDLRLQWSHEGMGRDKVFGGTLGSGRIGYRMGGSNSSFLALNGGLMRDNRAVYKPEEVEGTLNFRIGSPRERLRSELLRIIASSWPDSTGANWLAGLPGMGAFLSVAWGVLLAHKVETILLLNHVKPFLVSTLGLSPIVAALVVGIGIFWAFHLAQLFWDKDPSKPWYLRTNAFSPEVLLMTVLTTAAALGQIDVQGLAQFHQIINILATAAILLFGRRQRMTEAGRLVTQSAARESAVAGVDSYNPSPELRDVRDTTYNRNLFEILHQA